MVLQFQTLFLIDHLNIPRSSSPFFIPNIAFVFVFVRVVLIFVSVILTLICPVAISRRDREEKRVAMRKRVEESKRRQEEIEQEAKQQQKREREVSWVGRWLGRRMQRDAVSRNVALWAASSASIPHLQYDTQK